MRFSTFPASSAALSLDAAVAALEGRDEVVGLLFLGSTARQVTPWSDYDLLVVTRSGDDFVVECTYVDRRPTDVIFVSEEKLARATLPAAHSSRESRDLLGWLAEARIVFSRSEVVDAAPMRARELADSRRVTNEECYLRWVEANFNLKKAQRYLHAATPVYRKALELQMLRLLSEVSADFLAARGRPWAGEKDAVEFMGSEDPTFLELLLETRRSPELETQVANYAALVTRAFAELGELWPDDETSGGWLRMEGGPEERSRWESLLRPRE